VGSVAVVPAAWRPPQWSQPPMVLITVPKAYVTRTIHEAITGSVSGTGATADNPATLSVGTREGQIPQSYVFDAVTAADHSQTLTKTMHPVQTSTAITSHAYLEPATLVLYVLMSDAVAAYPASGPPFYVQPWTGFPSKSVSAYQQMLTLQAQRVPLTVTTRLRTYSNMLVLNVAPREDVSTIGGVRFRVEFSQIYVANVQATPDSARPNDTQVNGLGTVNPTPVPVTTQRQFGLQGGKLPAGATATQGPIRVDVPGAGSWTSVLGQLISAGTPLPGGF
jgi:hypothetical protein